MQRISSRHCSSECLGLCAIEEEAKTIISSEFVNTNLKVIAGHQLIHEHMFRLSEIPNNLHQ